MPADVLYFTRFLPTCDRGGGSRRLMQIWEVLKGVNGECELVSTQRQDRLSEEALRRIEERLARQSGKEYQFWSEKRRTSACRLGEISREWSRLKRREIAGLKLAIMDDPIYFIPLFEKLKHFHIPIIAICHNLESLVPEQVAADPRWSLFNKEIDLLAQCRMVITISREETFLLNNLGIKTMFFPYYPVESILNRLLRVREQRKKTEKKGIFLLGNVLNLQTRQGMEKTIDFWEANRLSLDHGQLAVAGYGTGQYLVNSGSNAVEFLGDLANDELDERLTRIKACLCFQEKGSGALTRIGEMRIANVLVLANSHAARSYYNLNDVIEFRELRDLTTTLKQAAEWNGKIPLPPAPDASGLIAGLKKMIRNNP